MEEAEDFLLYLLACWFADSLDFWILVLPKDSIKQEIEADAKIRSQTSDRAQGV